MKANAEGMPARRDLSDSNQNLSNSARDLAFDQHAVRSKTYGEQKIVNYKVAPCSSGTSTSATVACPSCSNYELNICAKVLNKVASMEWLPDEKVLSSTVQTVPARKTIWHPKDWSEYIPIICQGWASSSVTLADGRRQIMSFLLPGEMISTVDLLGTSSGRAVEAVTDVTYRRFNRAELKAFIFDHPDLLDTLLRIWIEERKEADQLALDLGRRTADERIARLILNLARRLQKRGMIKEKTMEFPLRQHHIADATGLTPVHVSKVMGEFQRAEMIELGGGRLLTIVNEAELHQVANWR